MANLTPAGKELFDKLACRITIWTFPGVLVLNLITRNIDYSTFFPSDQMAFWILSSLILTVPVYVLLMAFAYCWARSVQ